MIENQSKESVNLKALAGIAEGQHRYLRDFVRHADQKAIFFFGISYGLLAVSYVTKITFRWIKPITTWNMVDLLAFVTILGLTISAILFLWVIAPKLRSAPKGFIYFGAVTKYDSDAAYATAILAADPIDVIEDKLRSCYVMSAICNIKFKRLTLGLYVGIFSYILSILCIILK